MLVMSPCYRNIDPNPFNCPRLSLPKSTTSPHPKSWAAIGSAETIAVGGVPNIRAPPANSAPFCIQSRACIPAVVKVLSEFTNISHEDTKANEILLHMQQLVVVEETSVEVEKEDKAGSNSQLDRGRFEWYFVLNNSLRLQCPSPLSLTSCNRYIDKYSEFNSIWMN
jgi:hypothetical protein